MENLITGPKFDKYSLLASFLFLIKDIESEEKARELLIEIKRMLSEKIDNNFINDYLNINKDLTGIVENNKITIDQDNITNSTLYLDNYEKKYYLFSKIIRVNFNKNAKLFQYSNFMIYDYIKNRINYLYNHNIINELVEEIKEEIDNSKCQLVKNYIENNKKNKEYFFTNLFSNIDKDFNIPIELVSEILQTNIILLNKNKKIKKIIENNKNYKYILLIEKDKKYIPVYTKDKKIFYNDDNVLSQIKEEKEDNRLENIMSEKEVNKEDINNIKDYISNLGLEEA